MTEEELQRLLDDECESASVRWQEKRRLADIVRASR